MREIKFRAWTGKKIMYQDKQYLASFIRRIVPEIIRDHGGEDYKEHESYLPNGGVIDEYLMQYTGLKDKNDKEIYDGDIILAGDTKWTVAWHRHENGMDGWMVRDNKIHHWYIIDKSILRGKVIGNIYEKPKPAQKG